MRRLTDTIEPMLKPRRERRDGRVLRQVYEYEKREATMKKGTKLDDIETGNCGTEKEDGVSFTRICHGAELSFGVGRECREEQLAQKHTTDTRTRRKNTNTDLHARPQSNTHSSHTHQSQHTRLCFTRLAFIWCIQAFCISAIPECAPSSCRSPKWWMSRLG